MSEISHIKIHNILGIADLELKAGQFTEITGRNGSGKTSLLEAIKGAFRGGHDATLLRRGEEVGEAVFVLDDGMQVTKRVRADKSETIITGPDGKRMARPASVLDSLTDLMSVNPVDFLRATKKERVNVLLEAMPIELDMERLAEIVGSATDPTAYKSTHPLDLIDSVRLDVYNLRTGVNRAVKEKENTILQLSNTLPDDASSEQKSATDLMASLEAETQKRDAELTRVGDKLETLRKDRDTAIAAIQQKIAELQQEIQTHKDKFSEWELLASRQREKTNAAFSENTAAIREQIAAINQQKDQAARHDQTRVTITHMSESANELREEANTYTKAIENIDAYKAELIATLPVPGLEVKDGEIYRHGVQFDRLNTAQQVEIAVEIAKLRAGKLGVICVDGLELLDSQHFEEFKEQALASGLQLFVTRVSDTDFEITTTE